MKKLTVNVELHDLYSLLIGECRYGYTRNNHLCPGSSYEIVKRCLPKMLKKDKEYAIHTALQLCDECISSQLNANFYDGLDDEHGNRNEAIEFIEYLLNFIHTNEEESNKTTLPYNYQDYLDNIKRQKNNLYRLYEVDSFDRKANKIREITTEPISTEDINKLLFSKELKTESILANTMDIMSEDYPQRIVGEVFKIYTPESHKGRVYLIELTKEK